MIVKVKIIPIFALLTSPIFDDLEVIWGIVNRSLVQVRPVTCSFEIIAFLAIVESGAARGATELSGVELAIATIRLSVLLVERESGLLLIVTLFVSEA